MASPSTPPCPFLTSLPLELRLEIYAHLVTYARPLKLRQVIPGARDLAILRTNRQIHSEALEVLYEVNAIVVTRNDFCLHTDAALQTPLDRGRARKLWLAAFSPSIACTIRDGDARCAVCRPAADGLWAALRTMPKLREVRVDFTRHASELVKLREAMPGLLGAEGGEGRVWRRLKGDVVGVLRVEGLVKG